MSEPTLDDGVMVILLSLLGLGLVKLHLENDEATGMAALATAWTIWAGWSGWWCDDDPGQ